MHENNSMIPVLHIYYDRHFRNSSQFKDFQIVLHQLHSKVKDYADIIFTNC